MERLIETDCHIDMLGLILLCLLLTGTSEQKVTHVFSGDGKNVSLPCYDILTDCTSTTWMYYGKENSTGVILFDGGTKMNDIERHERLSIGFDCSLNIYKATTEDHGVYQFWSLNKQTASINASVYLHILHVSTSFTQAEMRPGSSVTLSCQLHVFEGYSCESLLTNEELQLIWVNEAGVNLQTDSRYQISSSEIHCNISLTFLNEDENTEWKCQVTKGSEVKTSVTYTVTYSASASATAKEVIPAVTTAVAAFFVLILLWLICKKRAGADKKADTTVCEVISDFTPATPPTPDVHGKTDDVTYAEVTIFRHVCKERQNVQSDDKVTYVAIRGANV